MWGIGTIKNYLFGILIFLSLLIEIQSLALIYSIIIVILGVLARIPLVELLIISLPVSFYIEFIGTANYSPSILVILLIVLSPTFWRTLARSSEGKSFSVKYLTLSLVLVLIICISMFVNRGQTNIGNIYEFVKLLVGFTFGFIAGNLILQADTKHKLSFLKIWVITSSSISLVGIIGFTVEAFIPNKFSEKLLYSYSRLSGGFQDPNLFATYLIVSLGFAILLFLKTGLLKDGIPLVVLSFALGLANSRGSQFAVVALFGLGLILFAFKWKLWFFWVRTTSISLLLVLISIPLITTSVQFSQSVVADLQVQLETFAEQTNKSVGSTGINSNLPQNTNSFDPALQAEHAEVGTSHKSSFINNYTVRSDINGDIRFRLWGAAIEMWKANPIFGVGYGNFPKLSDQFTSGSSLNSNLTHNTYLSLLAESGVFVFLLVLGVLIYLLWKLLRSQSNSSKILACTLLGVMVMMNAYNLQNSSFVWGFIGVIAALVHVEPKNHNLLFKTKNMISQELNI